MMLQGIAMARNTSRLRFRMRTVLLAMIPIALFCIWPGKPVVSHWARQYAFGQIRSTQGTVHEGESGFALKLDRSQLEHLSTLRDAGSLDLAEASLTDQDVSQLRLLRNLVFLDLSDNPISDTGLEYIAHCEKLTFLSLRDTLITSEGLKHVSQMTDLEVLVLDGTAVDDAGLKHLHDCNKLRILSLCETNTTADGIEELIAIPSLSAISVPQTWSAEVVAALKSEHPNVTVFQQRIVLPR